MLVNYVVNKCHFETTHPDFHCRRQYQIETLSLKKKGTLSPPLVVRWSVVMQLIICMVNKVSL